MLYILKKIPEIVSSTVFTLATLDKAALHLTGYCFNQMQGITSDELHQD